MKALQEIGLRNAIRFAILSVLLMGFRILIFPPLRTWFLRCLGAQIGKNGIIHDVRFFNCYRKGFKGLKIGDNCFIGDEVLIDLADEVVLADHVTLAERVTILTHTNVGFKDHPLQKYFPSFSKPVILEHGVFVGVNATILPGVTLGECSFVAAGAVVTHDVLPYSVVAGAPAKEIRMLTEERHNRERPNAG
jgi:maltose O-acetyltransferase